MLPRLCALLVATACASRGSEGARGQGEEEVVVPRAPAGAAWRTARGAAWKDVLEDLAEADVVHVAGDRALGLGVLEYLYRRGRLHAIGLDRFPRTAQKALDDFCFGRAEGRWLDEGDPVLAFARERRLPILALGLEQGIRDAMHREGPEGRPSGLEGLTEEQRRSLPALSPDARFQGSEGLVARLELDVAADVVVRWYRAAAPEGAQVAILADIRRIAPRNALPERLLARTGKVCRTLVALPGTAEAADPRVFASSYADYVWFTGRG